VSGKPLDRAFAGFAVAFTELRQLVDDDPKFLAEHGHEDPMLLAAAEKLRGAHGYLEWIESQFSAPVATSIEPGSIALRRTYEREWQSSVETVSDWELHELLKHFVGDALLGNEKPVQAEIDYKLANLKEEAAEQAKGIAIGFDILYDRFGNEAADQEWYDPLDRGWTALTSGCGLDVAGALWRRRWLPFILVPSHVEGADVLERRLSDAARAFIFGAPWACISLQRAVLEQILAARYGAHQDKLEDKIKGLSSELVDDLLRERLEWIRLDGNKVLHAKSEELAEEDLDRRIYDHFRALRVLIEKAPRKRVYR
jgi:hypothetical protein